MPPAVVGPVRDDPVGDILDLVTQRPLAMMRFTLHHDRLAEMLDRSTVTDILSGRKRARVEGERSSIVPDGFLGGGMRDSAKRQTVEASEAEKERGSVVERRRELLRETGEKLEREIAEMESSFQGKADELVAGRGVRLVV